MQDIPRYGEAKDRALGEPEMACNVGAERHRQRIPGSGRTKGRKTGGYSGRYRQMQVLGGNDGHTHGGGVRRAGAEAPTEGRVERVEGGPSAMTHRVQSRKQK